MQALKAECEYKKPDWEKLAADVEDLCTKLSPAERDALRERFAVLQQDFDKVENQINQRLDVCEQWSDYNDAQKAILGRIKTLQQKLESSDLTSAEIDAINSELAELQDKLQDLDAKRRGFDNLSSESETIVKDSASKQLVQTKSQFQNLQAAMMKTQNLIDERKGRLDELGKLSDKYADKQESLKTILANIEQETEKCESKQTSIEDLKTAAKRLVDLDQALQAQNIQRLEMHELASRMVALDHSQEPSVSNELQAVDGQWNTLVSSITVLQSHYNNAITMWKQYNDSVSSVKKELSAVDAVMSSQDPLDNQQSARQRLAQIKTAEQEMISHQRHLDQMNSKGQQLAAELRQLPGADTEVITGELETTNQMWNNSLKVHLIYCITKLNHIVVLYIIV